MLLSLRIHQFRCYTQLKWELPAEGAILLGDNAQGKTSLLEAICFALTLHSPRSSRLDRLARHGAHEFGISLSTLEGTRRIFWKPRHLELQNRATPCKDYGQYLQEAPPLTWLGNKDIKLVQGAAEERRSYLDFLGTQWHPGYREALAHYKKALRARNALLKNPRRSTQALHSFGQILAQHGEQLMQLREQLIEQLCPFVQKSHAQISQKHENVQLQYRAQCRHGLEEQLAARQQEDIRAGFTTSGPHRDELELKLHGELAQNYASEGQQRTLATAMQLGQTSLLYEETGRAPILLIDDIFGELDSTRRQALLSHLPAESQTIITTTQLGWLGENESPLPLFQVAGGSVSPAQ